MIWLAIFGFFALIVQLEFSRLALGAFIVWGLFLFTVIFYVFRLRLLLDDDHILFQGIFFGSDLDIEIKDIRIVKIFPKKRFIEFSFDNRNYRIITSKKAIKYFQKINDSSNSLNGK
ncbi:EbsA family protein [Oenococcus sp. UCMA 16435]|nr:EbsA family protein [Oenococcus sp. UCMA 16435]